MVVNDGKAAGDSGKQRPQARSAVSAGELPETAAQTKRDETIGKSSRGPTELPAQFGRYRVLKKLGGGGMGTVYLVENTELEREEALKVPHFSDGDDAKARARFLREAKSAAKLDHPNLCPVWDVGVLDGIYYLTMRFLSGKLLSDYTGRAQPARKAVEIVSKLAQALEAAHAKGVIHRDLKPSNIMMVSDVGPVVMDFGLAKEVHKADQKLTQAGSMLGTPAYMPPEQVNGELEQMGPASDVYSLGVILYRLLTGQLPFEGTMAAVLGQILYAEPPLPSALVPGLSPTLDGICRKAMAKASTERYPSMNAFAAALLDYLRSTPATEGAGAFRLTAVDEAADSPAATTGPGRRPAGNSDVYQIQAPMELPKAKGLPTLGTEAPSGGATIGPRSDPKPPPVMAQRAAERKTDVAVKKPGRKETRRAGPLPDKVWKMAILVGCFAVLVIGALSLAVTVFRPKQQGGTIAANNSQLQRSQGSSVQPDGSKADPSPQSQGKSVQPEASKAGGSQPKAGAESGTASRTVYLSDLNETDWSGHGMLGKNGKCPGGEDIAVSGTRFRKGLSTHPRDRSNCSVRYRLSGLETATFVTKVAINDTAMNGVANRQIPTGLIFQVLGDAEVLWTSAPMRDKGRTQECQISVKNVRVLELRVSCPGPYESAHAVWLDPYLLVSSPRNAAPGARKPGP